MQELTQRNGDILKLVVEEYLRGGQAIGSQYLVDTHNLELSSASIRSIMSELEDGGFLTHRHTSAGRIPTEKGVQHWLENHFSPARLTLHEKRILQGVSFSDRDASKKSARELSDLSDLAILLMFGRNDVYYTGISSLLKRPEFATRTQVLTISSVIDELDERAFALYDATTINSPRVLVGDENPLGNLCGLVTKKFNSRNGMLVGILGPMRMDYQKNYTYLETLQI